MRAFRRGRPHAPHAEGQPWLPGAPLSGVEVLGREEEALSWPRLYGSNGCMAHGEGGTIAG